MLIFSFVTGCADTLDQPRSPAVQIPQDCGQLAEPVSEPEWREGASAKAVLADTTVSLEEANGRLEATRRCQEKQAKIFAAP